MISEALELCVDGGRVIYSWYTCVVGLFLDVLGRDGGVCWYACGTKPGRCRNTFEYKVIHRC